MPLTINDKLVSPSRTYVCVVEYVRGCVCKEFTLPDEYKNDTRTAAHYYLNVLDFEAFLLFTMSAEVYYANAALTEKFLTFSEN